jgi:hypothetical protein
MGSPLDVWHSESILHKLASLLAFIVWIFLPRDLGAVGVAMIVRSDQQGEDLDLKSFVARYARIVWLVVPLSICLGTMILIGSVFIVGGLILAIWTAFVMPALATEQDQLGAAMRLSLSFTTARIGSLLGLWAATALAQIVALLALLVPNFMTGGSPRWWVGVLVGWSLFAVLSSLIFMARSVVLALLYLDAVRSEEAARTPLLR